MKNGKYELIIPPKNYPGKRYRNKYAYEHIVCWWKKTNELPMPGMEIHHINGNHRDNRFDNLTLVTKEQHQKIHAELRKKESITLSCDKCGKKIKRRESDYNFRIRS